MNCLSVKTELGRSSMEDLICALKSPGFILVCNCLEFAQLHWLPKIVGISRPSCGLWVSMCVQVVLRVNIPYLGEKKDPLGPISAKARAKLEQNPMSFTVIFFFQLPLLFISWCCWHCRDSLLFLYCTQKLSVCWEVPLAACIEEQTVISV